MITRYKPGFVRTLNCIITIDYQLRVTTVIFTFYLGLKVKQNTRPFFHFIHPKFKQVFYAKLLVIKICHLSSKYAR